MPETANGCVQTARGPLGVPVEVSRAAGGVENGLREEIMLARVGHSAPDFEAGAFLDGVFKNLKLSDFKGKWVVLCFYPGDFTFV
jgi:hypothetical protein